MIEYKKADRFWKIINDPLLYTRIIMKSPRLIACLAVLLLLALPGCGGEVLEASGKMSVCGMACKGNAPVEFQIQLTGNASCREDFLAFQESHASQVCGYAWEVVPTSRCIGVVLVGSLLSIGCAVACSEDPDQQLCMVECLIESLELEGNCLICVVEEALAFQGCIAKPALSETQMSACVDEYIIKLSACSP